jgi:SAM-dependent methyltransferase
VWAKIHHKIPLIGYKTLLPIMSSPPPFALYKPKCLSPHNYCHGPCVVFLLALRGFGQKFCPGLSGLAQSLPPFLEKPIMHFDDVMDLGDFYRTPIGQIGRRFLRQKVRANWPSLHKLTLAGLGYAVPYLGMFREETARTLAFMPAEQGAICWPEDSANNVALVDLRELPLADMSVDRLLVVHALEVTADPRSLLREAWRVLAAQGELLVIVPNRRGLLARLDTTPFGLGQPFSPPQLKRLLRAASFTPESIEGALYCPPIPWRLWLRGAGLWERLGQGWLGAQGAGLLLARARKELYARVGQVRSVRARQRFLPALRPQPLARRN